MTIFNDGAPTTPSEYLDMGCDITPCIGKRPYLANWQNIKTKDQDWITVRDKPKPNIGSVSYTHLTLPTIYSV